MRHILGCPREIRDLIYDHLIQDFINDGDIPSSWGADYYQVPYHEVGGIARRMRPKYVVDILLVNSQIRNEFEYALRKHTHAIVFHHYQGIADPCWGKWSMKTPVAHRMRSLELQTIITREASSEFQFAHSDYRCGLLHDCLEHDYQDMVNKLPTLEHLTLTIGIDNANFLVILCQNKTLVIERFLKFLPAAFDHLNSVKKSVVVGTSPQPTLEIAYRIDKRDQDGRLISPPEILTRDIAFWQVEFPKPLITLSIYRNHIDIVHRYIFSNKVVRKKKLLCVLAPFVYRLGISPLSPFYEHTVLYERWDAAGKPTVDTLLNIHKLHEKQQAANQHDEKVERKIDQKIERKMGKAQYKIKVINAEIKKAEKRIEMARQEIRVTEKELKNVQQRTKEAHRRRTKKKLCRNAKPKGKIVRGFKKVMGFLLFGLRG
ncbi:uncharacterized protein K452DRAFT_317879 [Aplosporella prunicola CBS 121167]|uniref:Uncharacterized protein n=1 Tax=Aplosporella prunicola CBS 121167 TaxID=1176127 RepID=A0A6A6BI22_9PEZI|nr:uncharacterized protein K452DRAFT_317879 [Aplosporella prunicola CBS 121167]KAF2142995.1 hypothetical protein K452DRAFT_317879 [Aplosporella prunicola CBS 121167]